MSELSIKLIIGLANPIDEYDHTRHNAGAWLLQRIAQIPFNNDKRCKGSMTETRFEGETVRLFIPSLYMNENGESVQKVMQYYKLKPSEILIVHDELDLEPGDIRIKFNGGHGGHNGLRSVFEHLGTEAFYRIRIGIGKPAIKKMVSKYVLSKPSPEEKYNINKSIDRVLPILPLLLTGKEQLAMNKLHST